jgi:hypothetical protein
MATLGSMMPGQQTGYGFVSESDVMLDARLADQRCKDAERREAVLKEKVAELQLQLAMPAKKGASSALE